MPPLFLRQYKKLQGRAARSTKRKIPHQKTKTKPIFKVGKV
jgi:hypothetical protein